ncbi:ubiquitin-specific protease doa4, partial [Spiromyces aspiralis]
DKIESLVTFPIDHLDMTKYVLSHISDPQQQQLNSGQAFSETQGADNLSTSYRLYAVANHYGTLTGGHYTANVFNGHLDEWNNFDDTR